MIFVFTLFGALSIALYGCACIREGTYFHALSPSFGFYFLTSFVFEPLFYSSNTTFVYNTDAFFFVYLCDFASYVGLTAAYFLFGVRTKVYPLEGLSPATTRRFGGLAWMFLFFSSLVFLPVAIEFRDYVFSDPRRLYELTRIGFGQYLFLSVLLLNLALVCFLFSSHKGAVLFLPSIILLSLFKGAKGPTLILLQICAIWAVYVRGIRVTLSAFVISSLLFASSLGGLFFITLRGVDYTELVAAIASYSDYNRHAALTVTDPIGPFYGRIIAENFFYSRLPRILDPEKPKNFGAFLLAEHYVPEQFYLDTGSPAFGAGVFIADFGVLTPVFTLFLGLFNGFFLASCIKWLRRGGGVAAFIPLLYFANIALIPIPMGFMGIEHWLVGIFVSKLSRLKLRQVSNIPSHLSNGNSAT